MPTRRERRSAELKCQECGYKFAASVPYVVHTVEDNPQPVSVAVDRLDVNCPNCGSRFVGERNA